MYNIMNKRNISYDIIDEREDKENMYTIGEHTYKFVINVECDYDLILVPANYLLFTLNWDGTNEIDSMLKKNNILWYTLEMEVLLKVTCSGVIS
ncbi:ketopantoate reductase PanE/ApbA (plasmid) [Bacillus thuringiensis MC28]|nr:ketopantoate reductase PanE/ApbA [Bacillus thuringiensis MC28]